MQHGALSDDTLLRPAIIASGILDLSRTDRCSRAHLRAALSLLDATEVPGYQQSRPQGRQVVLELAQPVVRQHGYDLIKECGVSFTLVA